jgi:hypothetical protein
MRAQFIRGQEPKEAMDIGIRSWSNLKSGDILEPKKEVDVDKKGAFVSRGSGDMIWVNMFVLVLKVQRFYDPEIAKHIIHIEYFKCWDKYDALARKKQIHDMIPVRRMFGTREQMENRFNILQKKDENI